MYNVKIHSTRRIQVYQPEKLPEAKDTFKQFCRDNNTANMIVEFGRILNGGES